MEGVGTVEIDDPGDGLDPAHRILLHEDGSFEVFAPRWWIEFLTRDPQTSPDVPGWYLELLRGNQRLADALGPDGFAMLWEIDRHRIGDWLQQRDERPSRVSGRLIELFDEPRTFDLLGRTLALEGTKAGPSLIQAWTDGGTLVVRYTPPGRRSADPEQRGRAARRLVIYIVANSLPSNLDEALELIGD